jgi:hypothetical protein
MALGASAGLARYAAQRRSAGAMSVNSAERILATVRKHKRIPTVDLMDGYYSVEFIRCISGVACYLNQVFVGTGKTAAEAFVNAEANRQERGQNIGR